MIKHANNLLCGKYLEKKKALFDFHMDQGVKHICK